MLLPLVIMGLAFFSEACFGFGGSFIAVPLLSLYMPPKDAVFLMLIFHCLKAVLLVTAWKHIDWKQLRFLPLGALCGVIIGTTMLDLIPPNALRVGLALYLIAFVAADIMRIAMPLKLRDRRAESFLAGAFGGVFSGLIGMGGPAIATYLRSLQLDKMALRATLIMALTISNYFRLSLDFTEIIHNATIRDYFLPGLAVFVVVMPLGAHLPKFLSEQRFRQSIDVLLVASAIMLLIRAFIP